MRQTMRPVKLGRVIETSYLAVQRGKISEELLIDVLKVTQRRAREILLEMVRMRLLEEEDEGYLPTNWSQVMVKAIMEGDLSAIHGIMIEYPFYNAYYHAIEESGPVDPDTLLRYLTCSEITFNKTTISVLSDWAERIGSVQRNVFTNRYYAIKNIDNAILPALFEAYNELNRNVGISLQQRYVEIPRLRERVCELMKISRSNFDTIFLELYSQNIGTLELSGAPITTHAKVTQKKIKSVVFREMPDRLIMKLSSDRYLTGIRFGGKRYYYFAIHGRELR